MEGKESQLDGSNLRVRVHPGYSVLRMAKSRLYCLSCGNQTPSKKVYLWCLCPPSAPQPWEIAGEGDGAPGLGRVGDGGGTTVRFVWTMGGQHLMLPIVLTHIYYMGVGQRRVAVLYPALSAFPSPLPSAQ